MKRHLRDYLNTLIDNSKNLRLLSHREETSFTKSLELRAKQAEIEEKIKFIIKLTEKVKN